MPTAPLELDASPRTRVFRTIDAILRRDATLKRLFGKKGSYRSWTGDPGDAKPMAVELAPAVRITPAGLGEDQWYSPDSQTGDLVVDVELMIRGTNADDLMNAWWAIQRAIYPEDQAARLQLANDVQGAGSFSGMITFLDPAFDRQAAENAGYFHALGRMKVDVLEALNP